MSKDFDWKIEDSSQKPQPDGRDNGLSGALRFWATGLAILLVFGGGWFGLQRSRDRVMDEAQSRIQTVLDRAHVACTDGDGVEFFALQARDAEWQAAQMRPDQFTAHCTGLTVVDVQPVGNDQVATVSWEDGGEVRQRMAFFSESPLGTVQIPAPANYWGETSPSRYAWGTLITSEVDAAEADAIGRHVDELVTHTCSTTACLPERQPFTLEIRPDFRQTAAPETLFVPSPRLMEFVETGPPGTAFWAELDRAVVSHLSPGTIRFAVPPWLHQVIDFEREAALFMRENPGIRIEIVVTTTLPEEPGAELADYDGAAFTPSPEMVAAGLVRDLTDYATSDPDFDDSDFYEQVWQGAWWRERMWLMPQAGQMRLLFYDCWACDEGIMEPPSLRWLWSELAQDVLSVLMAAEKREQADLDSSWTGEWVFMDATRDSLLSYAYSQQSACVGIAPARCNRSLGPLDVSAALEWYAGMVRSGVMPDTAGIPPAEITSLLVNWQSVSRRAAIWIDDPVHYEHQLQYWRTGVVPFPGSDRFDGNTPLWVHGSFISQSSERPLDVWRWLVFLSDTPLLGALRYVPARNSVAQEMGYWNTLPRPLQEAMRTAFPFARPVSFDERRLFSRRQIESVTIDGVAPYEAATQVEPLRWFGR